VIHGVRVTGESAIRWIETDVALEPGTRTAFDGLLATVIVSSDQLLDSLTNVVPVPVEISLAELPKALDSSTASRELDQILVTIPALGSRWESDQVSGMVVSIDLKREMISVLDTESDEVAIVPFRSIDHGD
jgi:hypothetical protein